MKLTTEEILNNSFVVTIDSERVSLFNSWFKEQNLTIPKTFIGYELTEDFIIKQFQTIARLKTYNNRKTLKHELKIFSYLSNNASQWSIVQLAKFNKFPFVTIFEDDAKPVSNLKEKLDLLCSDIPDETDVLRLGYCLQFPRPTIPSMINSALPHSDNLIVKNLSGAQAYIVFSRYYDRFIIENKKQPRTDFIKINPTPDKNVFALKESLFNQVNLKDRPVISSWKLPDGEIIVNK